jgi:DNA-binding transcriptional MerR regulator
MKGGETMEKPDKQLFRTGEFAQKAGLTVRTLRWYDKVGLLHPSQHTESGQRLYSNDDFIRLQSIITLKYIGLSLDEIKQLILTDKVDVKKLLHTQQQTLHSKLKQLQTVIFALSRVQAAIANDVVNTEEFIEVIKAINMSNQFKWFNKFYSDEQKTKLAERGKNWTAEDQNKATEAWNTLFADIRSSMDKDPSSPEAQALVKRWDDLIGQFTQGDSGITSSLNNAYAHLEDAPKEVQQWAAAMKDVNEFIQKARKVQE